MKKKYTQNATVRFQLLSILCLLIARPADLYADGGTIRLSQRVGGCQVTVFTAPTPLRTGRLTLAYSCRTRPRESRSSE